MWMLGHNWLYGNAVAFVLLSGYVGIQEQQGLQKVRLSFCMHPHPQLVTPVGRKSPKLILPRSGVHRLCCSLLSPLNAASLRIVRVPDVLAECLELRHRARLALAAHTSCRGLNDWSMARG